MFWYYSKREYNRARKNWLCWCLEQITSGKEKVGTSIDPNFFYASAPWNSKTIKYWLKYKE